MIIRILTEGQFNLPGRYIDELNEIDNQLVEAVEAEDREKLGQFLKQMQDFVKENGSPVPIDELVESDLILPEPDITLEEAQLAKKRHIAKKLLIEPGMTGIIGPNDIVTNAGAKPGDNLVLTKPIGTGVIATAGKAGIAVAIGRVTLGEDAAQLAGFAAFLGHLYPVYLGFRGGKGVATFFGTLLVLAWPVGLASGAVWLVMAKLMRYSSLAALVASVSSLIWVFVFGYTDAVLLCAALTALIYLRHAANIARLRQGTEPKIGAEKKAAATSGPDAP